MDEVLKKNLVPRVSNWDPNQVSPQRPLTTTLANEYHSLNQLVFYLTREAPFFQYCELTYMIDVPFKPNAVKNNAIGKWLKKDSPILLKNSSLYFLALHGIKAGGLNPDLFPRFNWREESKEASRLPPSELFSHERGLYRPFQSFVPEDGFPDFTLEALPTIQEYFKVAKIDHERILKEGLENSPENDEPENVRLVNLMMKTKFGDLGDEAHRLCDSWRKKVE